MDALAKDVISGTAPNPGTQWVGVFRATDISRTETGMRFLVDGTGFLDRGGFMYSTTPLAEGGHDRVSHVDDEWYTWNDHF